MTARSILAAAILALGLAVLVPLAVLAGHSIADIVEQKVAELPCPPGSVKKAAREAGSCLGGTRNRVANEPIAFCVRTRTTCVPAADGRAAPAPATEAK